LEKKSFWSKMDFAHFAKIKLGILGMKFLLKSSGSVVYVRIVKIKMSKRPLWLKSNCESCPKCGQLVDRFKVENNFHNKKGFTCEKCCYHCSEEDYTEDFEFKAGFNLDFGYNNLDTSKYY
jgi:hypothetical protein